MARFHGLIGYGIPTETPEGSGIVKMVAVTKPYTGDVLRNSRRLEDGSGLNDDITVSHTISVIADAYAFENFQDIKFVEWMGTRWKVTTVLVQRPRMLLTLGSVYNGPA